VLVVSLFPDFLPIIKSGVQLFAAHVQNIASATVGDAHLPALIAESDVVVFSTGAEAAAAQLPSGAQSIEYRHNPDPGDIGRVIMPFVISSAGAVPSQEKDL
jgi:hypothetical protein